MIYCVFPGSFKDERLDALAADFHQRLSRLWPVTLLEIPETDRAIQQIIEKAKSRGKMISLDAGGALMKGEAFASWVTGESKDLYFFVWGASGPKKGWASRADRSLSLSPMTTSHELARVFLLEQLYRAGATLRGHPYVK